MLHFFARNGTTKNLEKDKYVLSFCTFLYTLFRQECKQMVTNISTKCTMG